MYKVFYFNPDNPLHLQTWLNEQAAEGLTLVAATGGYFIFTQAEGVRIQQAVGTIEQGARVTGVKIDRFG